MRFRLIGVLAGAGALLCGAGSDARIAAAARKNDIATVKTPVSGKVDL